MRRRFEDLFLVVLVVGDVFCNVRIRWRQSRIHAGGIDIEARVDARADFTCRNARLGINLIDSPRFGAGIHTAANAKLDRGPAITRNREYLIIAG